MSWNLPSVQSLRSRLDTVKGLRSAVQANVKRTTQEIQDLEKEEELLSLVSELFRRLINTEISTGVSAVEKLLSEGLRTVFSDMTLVVQPDVRPLRGQMSVDLVTKQKLDDGAVVEGLSSDSFGGSVTTVQSVLMRILITLRRGLRPLLILDESLPAFDPNYVYDMGQFLSLLCQRLGMDILHVTQNPAFVASADRAYRIVRTSRGAKLEVAG